MGKILLAIAVLLQTLSLTAFAQMDTSHRGYHIKGAKSVKEQPVTDYTKFRQSTLLYASFGRFHGNRIIYKGTDFGTGSSNMGAVTLSRPLTDYVRYNFSFSMYNTTTDTVQDKSGASAWVSYNTLAFGIAGELKYPIHRLEPYLSAGIAANVNNMTIRYTPPQDDNYSINTGGTSLGVTLAVGVRAFVTDQLMIGLSAHKAVNMQKLSEKGTFVDYGGDIITFSIGTLF